MLLLALGTAWGAALLLVALGLARAAARGDRELVSTGVMHAAAPPEQVARLRAEVPERHLRAA